MQILPSHSNTVVSWRIDSGTESLTPTEQEVRNLSTITIAFATGADSFLKLKPYQYLFICTVTCLQWCWQEVICSTYSPDSIATARIGKESRLPMAAGTANQTASARSAYGGPHNRG